MTNEAQQVVYAELDRAISENKPWVVFNYREDMALHFQNLHYFESAGEAEQFCGAANGKPGVMEQMLSWDDYRYMQAAALKESIVPEIKEIISYDITAVARQMAEKNLFLMPGIHYDVFENALSGGQLLPVSWQRTIDPIKEIGLYYVLAYWLTADRGHGVNHMLRVYESFSNYKEARDFMDYELNHLEFEDRNLDFTLFGRFHNKPFELDLEGFALPHSGVTLVAAYHNDTFGHDFHELHSLSEPLVLSQYFFAGLRDGKLTLFDDKLKPTGIDMPQQQFYPMHYKYDYLTIKNSNTMNEQSFDYVKNQLFYLGFGEEVAKPLREKMEQNLTEFTVPHTRKFGQDETSSVLHFSKGDQKNKDMTFFNRADITLKQPGKEDLTQTFFFGKEHNYTLQERYNMMDGRAAYREQPKMAPVEENGEVRMKPTGETYYAWRGLDFKNADQYGNFNPKVMFWNHEKEVGKYPIKGIEENYDKQRLIAKLEKGNEVDVILLRDGRETLAKMVANPRMARLDFYDNNGQSLIVRKVEKQAVDQTQKADLTPQEVQKAAITRAAEQKQETGRSQNGAAQTQSGDQKQTNGQTQEQSQKENTSQQVTAEQQEQQTNRRRQGARL
jgi:hypothetical protein